MSTVFITGGAGLIGSHTVRKFASAGYRVIVFDSFQQYMFPPLRTFQPNVDYRSGLLSGAEVVRGSTENKDHLQRELRRTNPDYVIHLAGLPLAGIGAGNPEEAFSSIVMGTTNVLGAMRDLRSLKRFVYTSSSMAYGNFATVPLPETALMDPIDIYGAMKLAGEHIVRAYGRQFGIPYAIVRPSAAYGPGDNNRRVIQSLIEGAFGRKSVMVNNPDTTFLDFTYVTDLAAGLFLVATTEEASGEAFNLTYGEGRSLSELVTILRQHFPDMSVNVKTEHETLRPARGTLDITKATTILGYRPEVPLEKGVARYVEYVRAHFPTT